MKSQQSVIKSKRLQVEKGRKGTKNVSFLHGRQKLRVISVRHSHVHKTGSHGTFQRVIVHLYGEFDTLFLRLLCTLDHIHGSSQDYMDIDLTLLHTWVL